MLNSPMMSKDELKPLDDVSPLRSPYALSNRSFSETLNSQQRNRNASLNCANTSSPLPTPVFFFNEKTFSLKKERQPRRDRPPPTPKPHMEFSGMFGSSKQNQKPQSISFIEADTPLSSKYYNESSDRLYFNQCFNIICKLGSGSFGEVFKARCKEDGKYYAIKRSKEKFYGPSDRLRKIEEVKKHERLPKHQNCVRFYRAWEEKDHLYIQLELCEISLSQYSELNHNIPETVVWNYLVDLSLAVKHLHDHNFVHLDIKPENIFVSQDGICKLGDFGLMLDVSKSDINDAVEGDSKYLAPELMQSIFTKAADVFSLGITILELACDLDLPQGDTAWHQLRQKQIPSEFLKVISSELAEVIQYMMEPDHMIRPSIDDILKMDTVYKVLEQRTLILEAKKEASSESLHSSFSSGWDSSISDGEVFETHNRSFSGETIHLNTRFDDAIKSPNFVFDRNENGTCSMDHEDSFHEFTFSPNFETMSERKISTGKLNPSKSSSPKFSRRRLPFINTNCDNEENAPIVKPQNLMNLFDEQVSDESF